MKCIKYLFVFLQLAFASNTSSSTTAATPTTTTNTTTPSTKATPDTFDLFTCPDDDKSIEIVTLLFQILTMSMVLLLGGFLLQQQETGNPVVLRGHNPGSAQETVNESVTQ